MANLEDNARPTVEEVKAAKAANSGEELLSLLSSLDDEADDHSVGNGARGGVAPHADTFGLPGYSPGDNSFYERVNRQANKAWEDFQAGTGTGSGLGFGSADINNPGNVPPQPPTAEKADGTIRDSKTGEVITKKPPNEVIDVQARNAPPPVAPSA